MLEIDKSISFDGRDIKLKVGLLAPQAGGSVLIESGDTSVLVTATRSQARVGIDFLPLLVDYEERMYAAGRIPGGFLRREGKPPEKVTLISRLIDRPLRPLFPQWLREDIQIVATTLSMDEQVPPDVLAVTGASIAVMLAKIPFNGPMAAVRVGLVGDDFIINPTYKEIEHSDLELIVAGSPHGVVMIEAGANQLPEQDILEAIDFGYEAVLELIQAQRELMSELGIEIVVSEEKPEVKAELEEFIRDRAVTPVKEILAKLIADKTQRDALLDEVKANIETAINELAEDNTIRIATTEDNQALGNIFKQVTKELMRRQIVEDGVRVDGRKLDEVRPVSCRVGVLPSRVHGTGLFNRGLTQVLSACTLGTPGDAQDLADDLHPESDKRYIHHYNFPPFSVGETKPLRPPGRREIGHGALAERSIIPVLPSKENFPYVIRVVSEVLSSNGSTSMGSVCGSTLALMDAGVPILKPVSGAAMGLIKEGDEIRILTDIQGIEDFLGDMDFKVAGTDVGITALQMDMKITGLSMETVKKAILQARPARLHILQKMLETIDKPRTQLSHFAPRLMTIKIEPEFIGLVIGPGGKTIKGITEETGAKIDIEDTGIVTVSASDSERAKRACAIIQGMTKKLHEGEVYSGKVTRIIPIGAFVELLPGKEGMIHISQLTEGRVNRVEDVLAIGDEVVVKVREIDPKGRINLTRLGIHPEEAAAARGQ